MSAWSSRRKNHSRRHHLAAPADKLAEDAADRGATTSITWRRQLFITRRESAVHHGEGDICLSRGWSQLFIARRETAVRSVGYSQLFFRAKYQLVILGIPHPRLPPGISTGEPYTLLGYPRISALKKNCHVQGYPMV